MAVIKNHVFKNKNWNEENKEGVYFFFSLNNFSSLI